MKNYIGLLVILILVGCTSSTKNPIYMLPPGSELILNQDIAADRGARIYIQRGRVTPRDDIDLFAPHCKFHVKRTQLEMEEMLVIEKGVFVVTRSFREADYASDYASLGWVQLAGGNLDTNRSLSTVMELEPAQGFIELEFICSRRGSPSRDGFVQLVQMQDAVTGIVDIKVGR